MTDWMTDISATLTYDDDTERQVQIYSMSKRWPDATVREAALTRLHRNMEVAARQMALYEWCIEQIESGEATITRRRLNRGSGLAGATVQSGVAMGGGYR